MIDFKDVKQVNCSNCEVPLYGYIPKPNEDKTYRISAGCPHCGDKAFPVKATGKLIFCSTEYTNVKPRPVYKERATIADPLEYTDEIIVETDKRKKWSKK